MARKNRIQIDPKIQGGKPVIKGTRVPVYLLVGAIGAGMTFVEVCEEYRVTMQDIKAALTYAAEVLAQEKVHALPR